MRDIITGYWLFIAYNTFFCHFGVLLKNLIKTIIKELGLDQRNYYQINNIRNSNLPHDLIEKLSKLNVDAIYLFGEIPTLLFKFSPQHNKEDLYTTLLKSWNFDKAPILFYVTNSNITIYNR